MRPKILVIRFSSIGDIVLTSPIVRCLQRQLKAEVHFLTKKRFARQVGANPHLSTVYAIARPPNTSSIATSRGWPSWASATMEKAWIILFRLLMKWS